MGMGGVFCEHFENNSHQKDIYNCSSDYDFPALPCGSTHGSIKIIPGFHPGARPCAKVADNPIAGRPGRPSGPVKT